MRMGQPLASNTSPQGGAQGQSVLCEFQAAQGALVSKLDHHASPPVLSSREATGFPVSL